MYKARIVGRYSVFKRIFHECNKHHRGNRNFFSLHIVCKTDVCQFIQSQFLKSYVLSDIIHFFRQRDKFPVGIVVHILGQVDKTFKSYLCLVRLGNKQSVERVERIEEEMRIYLCFIECEFRPVTLIFHFSPRQLLSVYFF